MHLLHRIAQKYEYHYIASTQSPVAWVMAVWLFFIKLIVYVGSEALYGPMAYIGSALVRYSGRNISICNMLWVNCLYRQSVYSVYKDSVLQVDKTIIKLTPSLFLVYKSNQSTASSLVETIMCKRFVWVSHWRRLYTRKRANIAAPVVPYTLARSVRCVTFKCYAPRYIWDWVYIRKWSQHLSRQQWPMLLSIAKMARNVQGIQTII